METRAFPTRAWLRAQTMAFDGPHLAYALRDSTQRDDPLLVQAICDDILPARGITAQPQNILVTAGVQQALWLLASALLQDGRTVAVENPGYPDAAQIFAAHGAEVRPLPVDHHGVQLDRDLAIDVLYVTPSHQHPTNVTLSLPRRIELLRQARQRDFLVIEDDYDSEVRYRGAPTRPLRSMDDSGRVVYLGTFAKFLAPGLRLGYVVAAPEMIEDLRRRRFLQTKHPPGVLQRALALFVNSGDFHRALREHRARLQLKWGVVDAALQEYIPWPQPPMAAGGLSTWVTGPADFDATELAYRVRAQGVLISPGEAYYLTRPHPRQSFRLGFNAIPVDRIARGVAIIGETIATMQTARPRHQTSLT